MIVGSDGKLYGVTYRGGTGGIGVIFTLTTSGTYTIIAQVPQPGTPPTTSLVQGTDGKFYGIFGTGSSGANGVIYSVTTAGTITYLHSFCQETNCTDGYGPSTPMVQATDGKFYGVTSGGGISGNCMCGVFYSFDVGLGPFVSLVSTSGKEGAQIGILGQGFTGASVVKFGGTQATTIHRSGATFISATVPAAALTGSVTVTTGATTLTSNNTFRVTPTFPSFNPTSGPVGTPVVLTGTGLAQTTKVTFGRVAATTVTVNSDTQVTANVPTGARTGKITITTAGGSVTSRTVFTVN